MNLLVPILVIGAVAALAMAVRAFGGRNESVAPPDSGRPSVADDDAKPAWDDDSDEDDELEGGMVEAVAITSDGWAFVPRGAGVEVVPPGEDDEMLADQAQRHGPEALTRALASAPLNPHTGKRVVFWKPGETLGAGDLIATRIVRGAPGVDPWRLEALGRDYDYRSFAFETEDAAKTAQALLDERIVRGPRDGGGEAIPVGAEDFAVARRQHAETEQALAMEPDEEEDTER
jgi:hypothetical protein